MTDCFHYFVRHHLLEKIKWRERGWEKKVYAMSMNWFKQEDKSVFYKTPVSHRAEGRFVVERSASKVMKPIQLGVQHTLVYRCGHIWELIKRENWQLNMGFQEWDGKQGFFSAELVNQINGPMIPYGRKTRRMRLEQERKMMGKYLAMLF